MKKLIKIMLSMLTVLSVIVIAGIKPVEASTHIDEIRITVVKPEAGEHPSYYSSKITCKPAVNNIVDKTQLFWYECDEENRANATEIYWDYDYFKAGKYYFLETDALIGDGDGYIDANTKIYVNDEQSDSRTWTYFIGHTALKAVYLYVDTPKAGEQIASYGDIYTYPYSEDFSNQPLQWYVNTVNSLTSESLTEAVSGKYEEQKFYHPSSMCFNIIDGLLDVHNSWYSIDWENTVFYINDVREDWEHMRFYTGKELTRIYGDNRYKTSMAIADVMKRKWQPGSEFDVGLDEVIIASAENFADALAVSYASFNPTKEQPRPIVVVNEANQDFVEKYIRENFRTSAQIYIIGGTKAVPEKIEKNLKKDYSVKRIAGTNRYDTNLKILETFGLGSSGAILVATGTNFADSLSASAIGVPMLLVGSTLNDDQKMFLQRISGKEIYVLGGESAVSKEIETELKKYASYYQRIAGANRYETSMLIARKFAQGCSGVAIAYGKNFPDGLCGGPLAGRMNAPLLLVDEDHYSYARQFVKDFHVDWGYAFGGAGVISDTLFKKVLREQGVCPIYELKHE